ncbi:hypothetical protein CTM97_13895 [Photobacterium phosphoreum]|nr:hypothetical protein CTM97_13895 [Photobacterium phosphoreum]
MEKELLAMKIFWCKLNNEEKARRSFIMIPFMFLILLFPDSTTFFMLSKWEFTVLSVVGMIIQGGYYKYKVRKENKSKK